MRVSALFFLIFSLFLQNRSKVGLGGSQDISLCSLCDLCVLSAKLLLVLERHRADRGVVKITYPAIPCVLYARLLF